MSLLIRQVIDGSSVMKMVIVDNEVQPETINEDIVKFQIQKERDEHTLRIILCIILPLVIFFFQGFKLIIFIAVYIKFNKIPVEIAGVFASVSILEVFIIRRIVKYLFPIKGYLATAINTLKSKKTDVDK